MIQFHSTRIDPQGPVEYVLQLLIILTYGVPPYVQTSYNALTKAQH